MVSLSYPSASTLLPRITPEIWIAGRRRTDAFVHGFSQAAGEVSDITIEFPTASYDALVALENDLVEIVVAPFGVLWRGFITSRNAQNTGELSYTALGYESKLQDVSFWKAYNYKSGADTRNMMTVQALAIQAQALLASWQAGTTPTDYVITWDVESFPAAYFGELDLEGTSLWEGLSQALAAVDGNYFLTVEHTTTASTVRACYMGLGNIKRLVRGTDATRAFFEQRHGSANVESLVKNYSVSNTYSHIYAHGAQRVVETSLALSNNWLGCADEDIPTGADNVGMDEDGVVCVPDSLALTIVGAWDSYTKEYLDLGSDQKIRNPNYRPEYEKVFRQWKIDRRDDTWNFFDDSEQPSGGETSRKLPLVDMVRPEPNGPFVVFRREGSASYEAKLDGFTITEVGGENVIEFAEPFVERTSAVLWKDNATIAVNETTGATTLTSLTAKQASDNAAAIAANPTLADWLNLPDECDLTEIVTDPCYLVCGAWPLPFTVTGSTATTITVAEDLSGLLGDGETELGFFLMSASPVVASGTGGSGTTLGRYSCLGGTGLANEHVGRYLVLLVETGGEVDAGASKDFVYEIQRNDDTYVFVGDETGDLTGKSARWYIVDMNPFTVRAFAEIFLNAAYTSTQALLYASGDTGATENKRALYRANTGLLWRTQANNWILKPTGNTAADGSPAYTVEFNTGYPEHVTLDPGDEYKAYGNLYELTHAYRDTEGNPLTPDQVALLSPGQFYDTGGLQAWGLQQLAGASTPRITYQARLLMDLSLRVGDVITDNDVQTGSTITRIDHDLDNGLTGIDAEYRG